MKQAGSDRLDYRDSLSAIVQYFHRGNSTAHERMQSLHTGHALDLSYYLIGYNNPVFSLGLSRTAEEADLKG